MGTYAERRFVDDPLCTASARFTLGRGVGWTEPAAVPRPWGLRRLAPGPDDIELPAITFDHRSQVGVFGDGRAFVDVMSGPPTAPTTAPTDGEDPPSAEDWINDFTPDDPACPY